MCVSAGRIFGIAFDPQCEASPTKARLHGSSDHSTPDLPDLMHTIRDRVPDQDTKQTARSSYQAAAIAAVTAAAFRPAALVAVREQE